MPKILKSSAREILHTMINKYHHVKSEIESEFELKTQYLDTIIASAANLENSEEIRAAVGKLKEIEENKVLHSQSKYMETISSMTDVSVRTLNRIKKEGSLNEGVWNTPGKKRVRKTTVSNLDDFDICAIRNKINEFYTVRKQVPTLRALLTELREAIRFVGCRETLRQILLKNGFVFKTNQNERSTLIERFEISAWRHKYLRSIAAKRAEGKPIVYLDETYVHLNYRVKKSWQGPSTSGVTDKISPGKRYIIVHAGSENGFVPNGLLVFSTKSKSADYHNDMNSENFTKWLKEKLIPNLNVPSVIVMDNASYHVKQVNKAPTMQNLKATLQEWLRSKNIPFEECFTKAELLCLINENKPVPVYEAEEILKQHGHEVLKLPPYHCDLNPIEMIWSLAKRRVASRNMGVPASEMENLIKECFHSVKTEDWQKCTDHVLRVEEQYRVKDSILDNELEPFIINVGNESDSGDDDTDFYEDIEYLESDLE